MTMNSQANAQQQQLQQVHSQHAKKTAVAGTNLQQQLTVGNVQIQNDIINRNVSDSRQPTGRQNYVGDHNYNFQAPNYENYNVMTGQIVNGSDPANPYDDEVQDQHQYNHEFESEVANHESDTEDYVVGLGELSEADERVQRFYGIIPKEKPSEIKTVRMVKRDNKERLSSRGKKGEDDTESIDLNDDDNGETSQQPPNTLPRGNYQNTHSFLSTQSSTSSNGTRADSGYSSSYKSTADQQNNNMTSKSALSRPNFKLGADYYRSPSRGAAESQGSRPGSSLSAHERLFGTCRDDSMSPDMSPAKNSLASTDTASSTQSALMSPVFKSAAAKAIIEEERKTTPMIIPKARKKNKKRNMTITSSHPAVLEAITRHEKRQLKLAAEGHEGRSMDDLDLERILKPRDAPDVVRSTYGGEEKDSIENIDNLFGAPNKIRIPERYVPEQDNEETTAEEREIRLKKADSIRRMLAGSATPVITKGENEGRGEREQLLALNQVLARQVLERTRGQSAQDTSD